jgi:hypothetical protein
MSAKTFWEKLKPKSFANCKPTPLVGLQVALFHQRLGPGLIGAMADFTTKLTNKLLRHDAS